MIAINNEQIVQAVKSGNRPPLDAITGPADFVKFAKEWIVCCWHNVPENRPSFDGKHSCSDTHNSHCVFIVQIYKFIMYFNDVILMTVIMSVLT